MAEVKSIIGKLRGKVGNVVLYEGRDGKALARGTALVRKPCDGEQKRRAVAFGTVAGYKGWMQEVIRLGFPGGGKWLKGNEGFMSVNVPGAVRVEKVDADAAVSRRKRAMDEFRGKVDLGMLQVAAGSLERPVVTVDVEEGMVRFRNRKEELERVDCFGDDRVYGVVVAASAYYCNVVELGCRGEDGEGSVVLDGTVGAEQVAVYAFAVKADGSAASDSVCLRVPAL